jgi:hypothetical protein
MKRGYTFLWRKVWSNPVIAEPGRKFSRFEAWLYLVNDLAAGVTDNHVRRGEFRTSSRFLARAWQWSRSGVQRFFEDLIHAGMIAPVGGCAAEKAVISGLGHYPGHFAGQSVGHFIICNYEVYNPSRADDRTTIRATPRAKLKEVLNEIENNTGRKAGNAVSSNDLFKTYKHPNYPLPQAIISELDGFTAASTKQKGEHHAIDRQNADDRSGSIRTDGTSNRRTSRGEPAYIPRQ